VFTLVNTSTEDEGVTSQFREEFQRQERISARLAHASFRLEMAELERIWAIVAAHRQGMSVRDIARHAGLGPTRVHQLVTSPQADCVEQALSVLREAGWPTPEDPLPGAGEQVADRLTQEAAALISCAEWLASLAAGARPVVNLRPHSDLPDSDYVAVDQNRVIRVLRRIAYDLEELARCRRVADLSSSENDADPRLRLRRRLAEPPIEISRGGMSIRQSRQAWEDYESRLRRAGLRIPSNPYRHLDRSGN
jgi:AcrR family transcriptional regulator